MNSSIKYIIIGVVAIISLVVILLAFGDSKRSLNNWNKTYALEDSGPYGLSDFQDLIIKSDNFNSFTVYSGPNSFFKTIDSLENALIMYIGEEFYLTENEIRSLISSMYYGQEAFIALEKFPKKLLQFSGVLPRMSFYYLSQIQTAYDGKEIEQFHVFNMDTVPHLWTFIDSIPTNWDEKVQSEINGEINFMTVEIGEGKLHIHTNPMLFTNIYLSDSLGYDYFQFVQNQFDHKEVLWPKFASDDLSDVDPYQNQNTHQGDQSLLSEIFKYDAFKWAFATAIFGALLLILFKAKRKQPIIPVVNESMRGNSFVTTIAGIYYNKRQPKVFLNLIRRNFYANVKDSFYIDLQTGNRTNKIYRLAEKTNTELTLIKKIIKDIERNDDAVGDERLSQIHHDIMRFYKNSGLLEQKSKNINFFSTTNFYRKRTFNNGYIIGGIMLIIFGFMLLSYAVGFGVLLWPLGVFMLYVGGKSHSSPYLSLTSNEIIVTNLVGQKTTFKNNEITDITKSEEHITIADKNKKVKINLLFLKPADRYELNKLEIKK